MYKLWECDDKLWECKLVGDDTICYVFCERHPRRCRGWIVRKCRASRATGRTRALALSACALSDGAWRTPACTRQHPPRPRLRVPRLSQSSSVYILLRSESRDSSVILPGTHTEAGSQTSSRAPGQPITRARATRCRLSLRCAALPASSRACSRAPGPRQSGRRHLHPSGTHARAACRWPGVRNLPLSAKALGSDSSRSAW